jgi:hypothetical protein
MRRILLLLWFASLYIICLEIGMKNVREKMCVCACVSVYEDRKACIAPGTLTFRNTV